MSAHPLPIIPSQTCKICQKTAKFYGAVDFMKSCEDRGKELLPRSNRMVTYHRCPECEFLFSVDFDSWSQTDFVDHIYNAGYAEVDPEYATIRPRANARAMSGAFPRNFGVTVLDYGSGSGAMTAPLLAAGFSEVACYDPFVSTTKLPTKKFDIVACFEVLEHVPDPLATIETIISFLKPTGIVMMSTLVQQSDFPLCGLNWWYCAPRNGHISLFSQKSIEAAWARFGYKLASNQESLHVAYRDVPVFARTFLGLPPF